MCLFWVYVVLCSGRERPCHGLITRPRSPAVCKMIMKLKAEARAQGGSTASEKKNLCWIGHKWLHLSGKFVALFCSHPENLGTVGNNIPAGQLSCTFSRTWLWHCVPTKMDQSGGGGGTRFGHRFHLTSHAFGHVAYRCPTPAHISGAETENSSGTIICDYWNSVEYLVTHWALMSCDTWSQHGIFVIQKHQQFNQCFNVLV
jgi:hypothetical protein